MLAERPQIHLPPTVEIRDEKIGEFPVKNIVSIDNRVYSRFYVRKRANIKNPMYFISGVRWVDGDPVFIIDEVDRIKMTDVDRKALLPEFDKIARESAMPEMGKEELPKLQFLIEAPRPELKGQIISPESQIPEKRPVPE